MNKKYFFSHRVLAMLLTLTLCLGMIPTASAAQQNSYHDPVEHWQQASNRTNELDVNSIVTHETFYCATCRENTDFTVWRVPEYTRSGETALNRNVKYSNGMCIDEVTVGSLDAGVPGENAYYTGYHWTKSVCSRCGDWNSNETNGAPYWAIPVRIPGTCTGTESGWLQTGIYLCAAAGQCKKEHRICPAKGAGGVCRW